MTRPPIQDTNTNTGLVGLGTIPGQAPVAAFNVDQIESLLRTKGIRATHYRSAPSPARESVEAGVNLNTQAAQTGFVFYEAAELLVVPQNMNINSTLQVQGMFDNSAIATLNVTGNYTNGQPAYLKPRDIIVLNDTITAITSELTEYDPNGPLKLKYWVKGVDVLFSEDQRFKEGLDFEVRPDGKIYWLGGRRPGFKNGKGQPLSVCYFISPHYIINNVPHLLRILPSNTVGSGNQPRHAVYAPQLIVAVQSHLTDQFDYLNFMELPLVTKPNTGMNTTRG